MEVPLHVDYTILRAKLVEHLFRVADESLLVFTDDRQRNTLTLAHPAAAYAGNVQLGVCLDVILTSRYPMADRCVSFIRQG
ncbi:MAG: hypothetical protein ACI9BW_002232 [Gammaproteobacteria bacterium]